MRPLQARKVKEHLVVQTIDICEQKNFANRQDKKHLLHNMPQTVKIIICTVYQRLRTWTVDSVWGNRATFRDSAIQHNSEWNSETIIAHHTAKHQIFLIIHIKSKLINCVMFQRKMLRDLKYVVSCKDLSRPQLCHLPATGVFPSGRNLSVPQLLLLQNRTNDRV